MNLPGRTERTGLHVASAAGCLQVVELLLRKGADTKALDRQVKLIFLMRVQLKCGLHFARRENFLSSTFYWFHVSQRWEDCPASRLHQRTAGGGASVAVVRRSSGWRRVHGQDTPV